MVIYGGDVTIINGVAICGPETEARCRCAIEYLGRTGGSCEIFLAAGVPPKRPHVGPIREMMKKFLIEQLQMRGYQKLDNSLVGGDGTRITITVVPGVVYGTFEETCSVLSQLLDYARQVVVVSTDRHMKRILLSWFWLSNRRVTPITCSYLENNYRFEWLKIIETHFFGMVYSLCGAAIYWKFSHLKNKWIDH